MRNIALDTNGYAAFKQGDPDAIAVIQHAPLIGVSSIVLGELLSGFAAGQRQIANQQELIRFLASPRVTLLEITAKTAEYYAKVYLNLRGKGRPIPTNDMWIAASALQYDYAVLTYDHHFTEVDGLVIVSNLADLIQASSSNNE